MYVCEQQEVVVVFIERATLYRLGKDGQQGVINMFPPGGGVGAVRIIHYFPVSFAQGVKFGTHDIVQFSYSSSDPYYDSMWNDIKNSTNCRELVKRLEYWIRHYTIDPIRRIKHCAMNLFAPLDTDCQYLLELWGRGEYDKARRHLEDTQKDWQGHPPYSNSPLSKLARLWYLLVGDINKKHDMSTAHPMMKWPRFVWLGYLNRCSSSYSLCVNSPAKTVSLPGDKCLYEWLYKVGQTGSSVWENMLATAGLKRSNQRFEPNADAGIYRFVVELQKRVIEGNLPDLQPDTRMQGFKNCDTVEANFKQFHQWMRALNEGFETLVEEVGGVYR